MPRIAGHSTEPLDIWALAFMSLLAVMLFMSATRKATVLVKLKEAEHVWFAHMLFFQVLCGIAVILGCLSAAAIIRYIAIVHYCGSGTALN